LVGEIERCDFQWETRDLGEKVVQVLVVVALDVYRGEFGKPLQEAREERDGWNIDSERGPETVCDTEKLFGDDGERLKVTTVVVVVDKEFEDTFPTLIR
jgi:hypothetical protein